MPAWRFSNDEGTICCEVTKGGGYVSYFLKSRLVEEEKLSKEQALKSAEKYLDYLGILSMKTTYYDVNRGIMTINYAYSDLGTCVYTDLVKVSVAMDNGEILGYDASGFLVNHTKRSYPAKLFSKLRAQEKISPKLEVKSVQLAVIPTDNLEERLCYEFKCKASSGRNVLVYINAETGKEEQILLLVETPTGTLTA
jgi:germination protein YpeB